MESEIPKFLCDQMCAELGKWLRAAGYDTEIITTSMPDREILQKAIEEKRLLLTRDRFFKEIDLRGNAVIYLKSESLDEWAEHLKRVGVNWLMSPFSRCLQCNSQLKKNEAPAHLLQQLPNNVKEHWFCSKCNQIFWLGSHTERMEHQLKTWQIGPFLTFGLGGDLMMGRLVNECLDQTPPSYVWGNLLPILSNMDFNLVNLETTLTRSEHIRPKVFNFKADPEKVAVLAEGSINVVNVANNHILDFSEEGLLETLQTLDGAKVLHIGAGKNLDEARAPCFIEKNGIKIGLIGCTDNEPSWKATASHPGTHFVEAGDIGSLRESIIYLRKQVDLLILSIHWGPNMRKKPAPHFCTFAHQLIDLGVDIVHGHSAHVFQGVENYKNKLILYDTGDLVDDYVIDPILRNDRSFFFVIEANKEKLISLKMIPICISHFQVNVTDDIESLNEMKKLCNELKTYPICKDHVLHLDLKF